MTFIDVSGDTCIKIITLSLFIILCHRQHFLGIAILRRLNFISVQPALSVVPSSGVLAVKEGESATLQCDITAGSPTPEIKWSRRERMMPSGEEEISGNMITFSQVTRHHSGHYICSADNGFGPQPVTAQIKLDVQREYSVIFRYARLKIQSSVTSQDIHIQL